MKASARRAAVGAGPAHVVTYGEGGRDHDEGRGNHERSARFRSGARSSVARRRGRTGDRPIRSGSTDIVCRQRQERPDRLDWPGCLRGNRDRGGYLVVPTRGVAAPRTSSSTRAGSSRIPRGRRCRSRAGFVPTPASTSSGSRATRRSRSGCLSASASDRRTSGRGRARPTSRASSSRTRRRPRSRRRLRDGAA